MPRRAITTLLLATTALATTSTATFAQSAPLALGEIVVEADANGNTVVTTTAGSKLAVAISEVPQSVSVVGRDQLDRLPGAKADEVLRYTAGVQPSTYGTDADYDWVRVRGFQADQTGIFQDNLPLYQFGFGSFLIEPFLLERIEVLKGPASALYGGANVGGVINYVGKRPNGERLRYTEAGINNFGNAYVGFDVGDGTETGELAYRLTGKVSGGGWETEDASDLKGSVLGSVAWTPDAATSITVYGQYQNGILDHTSTGFLPYVGTAVDAAGGVRIPRDLNYGDPNFDSYSRRQAMIGYEAEHDLNDSWTIRQNARLAGVGLDEQYLYTYGNLSPANTLDRAAFQHDTDILTFTLDNQIAGTINTGAVEHKVLAGIDYKHVDFGSVQGSDSTFSSPVRVPPINVLDPTYGVANPLIATYLDQDIALSQLGIYAQDQMRLNGFIATVNGRYDAIGIDYDNNFAGTSVSSNEGAFTGRIGLGYEFDNGLTPYVSYATSFNPTIATTVGGELLPSERGRQVEVGVKYEPTFIDGLITASLFNIDRQNFAVADPAAPFAGSLAIGEVNLLGFEVEGQVNFDQVSLHGAVTVLDAEVVESGNAALIGKSPVQIPTLTASFGVEYAFEEAFEGLVLGAGVRVLGESWADDINTTEVPAVALIDASLRYERDDWGVALSASNLFDTDYVSSCQTTTNCGYGAGRTVTLSVHKSW
ncbi:TonB-dependent siderophore receptor [Devosia aurantiaca]|uniref:TonB-dependent siderophore receptor n=1 Tax=Devosia aurantiaca TaxID=2714858 RepID=A0A6M1STL3_9HYPH|nr:TonB-dependent siderophore receptor [Devosia aurantiaca]NGP18535.1 TonB-dependent siderophore receptor [Devosia aurantiaca]